MTFTVENTNTTEIDCEADGETYEVNGHVVAPEGALESADAVTLYLHGLSYGEFFLNYEEVPDYDFAEKQAEDGHVSVVIDRLGYDSSDHPPGMDVCFGSRADIAHQMVDDLRSGDYELEGAEPRAFSQVVLAGHSVGSLITEATAYTFGNMDAIMLLSYSDEVVSDAAMRALQEATAECEAGGTASEEGAAGYVFFGPTQEAFIMAHFFTENADPDVVDITSDIRNRDPCGDVLSYMAAVETNLANIGQIDVPALVLIGTEDAIYPTEAANQAELLTGTDDVTTVNLADTGHAVTLHRSAEEFQAAASQWLTDEGFGGADMEMPKGGVETGGGDTAPAASMTYALGGVALLGAGAAAVALRTRRRVGDES